MISPTKEKGSTFGSKQLHKIQSMLHHRPRAGSWGSKEKTDKHLQNNHGNGGEIQWCFSQVKGTIEEDITEADIISCVEFNHNGELLATGDKGGRVVIFQRDGKVEDQPHSPGNKSFHTHGEYNVYSTFQSHEPEFDYLKSLEIEEKINKIRWLQRSNPANFLLSTNDKTIKLWKVTERDKRAEGYNLKDDSGILRDPTSITSLRIPLLKPMELLVEASPRRIFANAHTYHINSISVNSDQETYLSADDLRINLWHLEVTNQSFNIVDIKPANMEELTEVITAAEFHPTECNLFVYSSSKGTIRLCDMRERALCDKHAKLFEEPEDPTNRSFFSEIISSISDVKFSHNGRYMVTRDYLSVKVWDLQMDSKPIETFQVHEYLRSKLCSLYENDCIFDKFECAWSGNDRHIMTGSYNNFFRMFDRESKKDVTLEASRENVKPKTVLKPRKVCSGGKRKKEEISVDCLDFNRKILHSAWHPQENILAVAATNNLYLFASKD
ncbi:serine/threonine-protein phosphatase 2A 55 kDa regulatory subunit B alpha isoform-like isoform X3 [Dreissena polymorpha]|nr:serine/threonine-protein phosphatase 2A 55 kDa regulatory subunit B alpha isoform-like isoform X3 [Dreissena polymorpha]XP_052269746.1 serine/threonine-protein phosphatase 2A 55 kDa regulatory subunit B alpha isoform-like isoform X3 [Dreissena polymorpha]XP_052269747.1 serine/threonine-protein phosphatase 2A 55 kDa regulatory subunit B alpha isoform-like isoform X3 [Dreissena polymorpha]